MKVDELVHEFIDYYTGAERHPSGGCGNCGGSTHSTTCFVGRFIAALAPSDAGERQDLREVPDMKGSER